MGTLNDAYHILVPGYGQCWVKHEDVEREIADTLNTRWRLKTHSITKLSIRADRRRQKSGGGGLGVLLELIGTPITHLCLDFSSSDQLEHSQLELIWTYCPNLVFLTISNVAVDSFHSIVDAYPSGRCQVSELSFNRCIVRDPACIIAFAETLADPNTRMSKTLRQPRLGLRDGNDSLVEGETLEAFSVMLETNERLWHLLVQVDEDHLHWSNRHFAPFRGQRIRSSLPWPSKCAFMSVAKHIHQLEGDRNPLAWLITRLDSLALARIFDFAGEIHTRSVLVKLLN